MPAPAHFWPFPSTPTWSMRLSYLTSIPITALISLPPFTSSVTPTRPRSHVPVYCPASVSDKLLRFVDDHEDGGMAETFEFATVDDGDEVEVGGIKIFFRRSDHSVTTVATRWQTNGRVLAYSADTGPQGDWMRVAEGADLFLCEASYQGEPGQSDYPFHLTAIEAGSIAREVGAKHLMLTHIPPHLESSRSIAEAEVAFDRPVELAVPGASRKI